MHQPTKLIALSAIVLISSTLTAQDELKKDKNKDKVTIEDIKPICEGLTQDKKPRLTVANFKLTAPNAPKDQYGDNLATMTTNALHKVQCYRVLERIANMGDVDAERKYQEGVNKKTAIKKENQMGANVMVQGEITEFEKTERESGFGPLKSKKYTAKVGLIIRLVDPETREVIASESFNVEKKTDGGLKIGVRVPIIGDINALSTAFKNPAVQDATEDCIIKAVQYIAAQKDKINMPASSVPDGSSQYTITFKNIQYEQYNKIIGAMEKIPGVSNVNGDDFENNIANVIVTQTIKLKEVVDKILATSTGVKMSVSGMSKEGATFTVQ